MLTVTAQNEPVGRVRWFPATWGPPHTSTCLAISIAIGVHRRGLGVGTQAQRLLVDYLFRNTRVERIQAITDVKNAAEQKALEKAGFMAEGTLRRAQWRDGAWHDQILYSIVRDDWSGA